MSDASDPLAELASRARKEMARLQRVENLDVRSELRHRIWPFLLELAETTQESFVEEEDDAITVDLVARTVGLILGMANRLSEFVGDGEMHDLAERAAEVTEELMAVCDPDELAAYVAAPASHPIQHAEIASPSASVEPGATESTASREDAADMNRAEANS